MGRQRFPLDRSAMFTCLLDIDPDFGPMDSRKGERRTTAALDAWYQDPGLNMYAFTQSWVRDNPVREED